MSPLAVQVAAVALGGAIGAALRYLATLGTHALVGLGFPYGTLLVNVLGSAIIGYLLVVFPGHHDASALLRLLLVTGVLGGFTTYSAFSLETLQMMQDGHVHRAGLYMLATVALCFAAVWCGYALGRWVHASA